MVMIDYLFTGTVMQSSDEISTLDGQAAEPGTTEDIDVATTTEYLQDDRRVLTM